MTVPSQIGLAGAFSVNWKIDSMIEQQLLKRTPGCPKTNWSWLRCIDLKEDEGLDFEDYEDCEYCGQEKIRFVHALTHSDWRGVIRVGQICAGRMTTVSPEELEKAEAILRNRSQRRQRFPRLKSWKVSAKGNQHIDYLGEHVIVMKRSAGYALKIGRKFGELLYPTDREAMLKAFDVLVRRLDSPRAGSRRRL